MNLYKTLLSLQLSFFNNDEKLTKLLKYIQNAQYNS